MLQEVSNILVTLVQLESQELLSFSAGKSNRKGFFGSLFKKSSPSQTVSVSADLDDESESAPSAAAPPKPKDEKHVKVKRNNTNAMVVHLSALAEEPGPAAGDPWYCRSCKAIVSSLSKLTKVGETVSWKW